MSFLNPLLLFGIGAVTVPIIVHLLMRRQLKRVVWAAMRFLQASVQRNEKRMRIENLLLLLVRCLLVALLALALARPAFHAIGLSGLSPSGAGEETAVIALDNSASMSQTDGASSRFDKARKAAGEIIDALPHNSAAAVFLVSDIAQASIPEPTRDLNLVRKTIRDAPLSSRSTDLQPAFRQALDVLKNRAGGHKAIYLVTDGQANAWTHLGEIRAMLQAARLEMQAYVVLTGSPEEHNLGISGLRLAGALSPARQPVRFEVDITNYGSTDAANVPVGLAVDSEDPGDEATIESIAPGASKSLSLFANFREPGYHTITARLPRDRMPADDSRTVAVRAFEQARLLMVDGKPGREPRDSEVFYLRNALMPVPSAQQGEYFIKPETIEPAGLDSARLADFEAVILANVSDISDAARDALDRYVHRGGGLIVFPGDRTDASFYNNLPFLPAKFGGARGDESAVKFFTLREKSYEHPIVSIWKDPASGSLATAHFRRAFTLEPRGTGSRVVMPFADGSPAIVECPWGSGRVIQFASTANTAWNDLPVRPVFVPLIHRVLGAIMNRQSERLNVPVGARVALRCEPELLGKPMSVVIPQSEKKAPRPGRVDLLNGEPTLLFDETDLAGPYAVTIAGDPPTMLKFAVQSNPEESKLAEAQLDSLAPARVIRWTADGEMRARLARERGGTELWFPLVILCLALAGAESVMAAYFSRSK